MPFQSHDHALFGFSSNIVVFAQNIQADINHFGPRKSKILAVILYEIEWN